MFYKNIIFSNYKRVSDSYEKKLLLNIANFGIKSVMPNIIIRKFVKFNNNKLKIGNRKFDLKNKRIFVIGTGKMSGEMASELEKIVGFDRITYGFVSTNFIKSKTKKIVISEANHPIPSLKSFYNAKRILEIKKKFNLNKNDIIIGLISGGGSSLLTYPKNGISFEDKKEMISKLIKSGADGHEIPVMRKRVSEIKGGKLAEFFYPTPIISLVVSDVVGDKLDVIASGPLVEDTSSFKDALNIIKKYSLENKIPKKIFQLIVKNKNKNIKQNLNHVRQFLLAGNSTLIGEIKDCAENLGLEVIAIKNVKGESKVVSEKICNKLNNTKIRKPTLFVYGGETVVKVGDSKGKGGRNQEFVATCLKHFNHKKFSHHKWAIASISSDGMDFIKESCGGIIDKNSFEKLRKDKINLNKYLNNHDSYHLLKKLNSNLSTNGLTGVHVADIMLFLFV